jgi:photosystem II stability/assembly factor-like uncharacterized protein
MKNIILIFLFCIIFCNALYSQPLIWRSIPTIPLQPTTSQMQDVYFINALTGWTTGIGVYKTTNGGLSWVTQSDITTGGIGARCIGFFDEQTGIAGQFQKYASQESYLYRTTNSGVNWIPITNLPVANMDSSGACGIYIVNSQVAYLTGRWSLPVTVLKTTNAGSNWINLNANIGNLATGVIASHFFSPDTGYIVGHTGFTDNTFRPVVLYTVNGGNNWSVVHSGSRQREHCWKIFFLTRQVGYITVQNFYNPTNIYLKTTNGGLNWTETIFQNQIFLTEGIGFVNENTGWIGGDGSIGPSNYVSFKTINGGTNWQQDAVLKHINKIIFLSDTLGYAAGETFYKYSGDSISSVKNISTEIPVTPHLSQNFPNPFNPSTKIRFYLATALNKYVELSVYDNTGKKLETLVNQSLFPGGHEVEWNASNYPSGIYFYKLTIENYTETRKMVLVK